MNGENHDQNEKAAHYNLCDALQTLLYAASAYKEADHNGKNHVEEHLSRIPQHGIEHAADLLGRKPAEGAGSKFNRIIEHPSGNGRVIQHQHGAAEDTEPAMDVPVAFLRLQIPVSLNGT